MNFYPIWPPFAGFVVLLLLVGGRWFGSADLPPAPRPARVPTLDGLRGFLALGVMFHHGAIYHRYLVDGVWTVPPSGVYVLLGTGGVAVFFMITGYLFWGRLIDEGGRPDWARLYVGRVFRIAPVYLLAILGMLLLVMMRSGWRLRVSPAAFVHGLAPWLALGFFGLDPTDVNGHPATLILTAGVTWSLHYEWLFYLALPLMAAAAGPGMIRFAIMGVAAIVGFLWANGRGPDILPVGERIFAALFLVGMGCATLQRQRWHRRSRSRLGDALGSAAIVALVLVLFQTCRNAFMPLSVGLLGICFYLVASGCTLFGLLVHRASRRLGDISYGIYMLQGPVLAVVFGNPWIRAFALASPWRHWVVVLTAAAILVVLAAAAHRWVERPGIALGRRIAGLLPAAGDRVRLAERAR